MSWSKPTKRLRSIYMQTWTRSLIEVSRGSHVTARPRLLKPPIVNSPTIEKNQASRTSKTEQVEFRNNKPVAATSERWFENAIKEASCKDQISIRSVWRRQGANTTLTGFRHTQHAREEEGRTGKDSRRTRRANAKSIDKPTASNHNPEPPAQLKGMQISKSICVDGSMQRFTHFSKKKKL